jgi:hypothetical protein
MAVYVLRILNGGNPTSTGLYVSVTGSTPNAATVQYGSSSSGPWNNLPSTVSTSYVGAQGGGNPQPNDKLTLSGSIGTNNLTGAAVYQGSGANGAGFYDVRGSDADLADWTATAS